MSFKLIKSRNRTEPAPPAAASTRAPPVSTGPKSTKKSADDGAFTPWDLAQIWIESVSKEDTTRKQWEQMHGWMADYDPHVFIFY